MSLFSWLGLTKQPNTTPTQAPAESYSWTEADEMGAFEETAHDINPESSGTRNQEPPYGQNAQRTRD